MHMITFVENFSCPRKVAPGLRIKLPHRLPFGGNEIDGITAQMVAVSGPADTGVPLSGALAAGDFASLETIWIMERCR